MRILKHHNLSSFCKMKNNHIFNIALLSTTLLSAEVLVADATQGAPSKIQKKKRDLQKPDLEEKTDSCAMELYTDCATVELKTQVPISPTQKTTHITQSFPQHMWDDSFHMLLNKNLMGSLHMLDFNIHHNHDKKDVFINTDNNFDVVQKVDADITYTTEGLSWQPFYTADLSTDCKSLNLNCWFTVHNETSTSFDNVHLKLFDRDSGFKLVEDVPPAFEKRSKNLFPIPRHVTLPSKQKKRIMWLQASNIPLKKEYVLSLGGVFLTDMTNSDTVPRVDTQLSWINTFKNLPLAPVTLYQESETDHKSPLMKTIFKKTELNMPVSFRMPAHLQNGDEQPIQVSYEQTEFQKFTVKLTETVNRLTLKNTKADPVTVKVCVNFPLKSGMIVRDSIPHQTDGHKKRYWIFNIQPGEKIDLKYRARVTSN